MKIVCLILPILILLQPGCTPKTVPSSSQSTAAAKKRNEIAVLSYNIHHANPPSKPNVIDLQAVANVINQQRVDIVALQEVDVHTARSGPSVHEAEELARLTGMKAFFAKAINYDGGEYGVAILSRYPLEETRNVPLPTDESTKGEHRTLASATVTLPGGQKFVFACTHLDAQKADGNRQLQIKKIVEVLKEERLPVVIAGDFNAVPTSDVIRQLDASFTRSCVADCGFTIPEKNPTKTIDYIAFAPAAKFRVLTHSVVDESYASDHRPVKAVLQLN